MSATRPPNDRQKTHAEIKAPDYFDRLPMELIYHILTFLQPLELTGFACCSHFTLALVNKVFGVEALPSQESGLEPLCRHAIWLDGCDEPQYVQGFMSVTGNHVYYHNQLLMMQAYARELDDSCCLTLVDGEDDDL